MNPAIASLAARLKARTVVSGECWIWTGATSNGGYGQIQIAGITSPVATHRLAYEIWVGPIPEGLHIDHLCRVRSCLRPEHLEAVTQAENNRRSFEFRLQGRCGRGHPHPLGSPQCKPCIREARHARSEAARARGELGLPNAAKTHCKWGHPLSGLPGRRRCITCNRERDRKRLESDPDRRTASIARSRAWHAARRAERDAA